MFPKRIALLVGIGLALVSGCSSRPTYRPPAYHPVAQPQYVAPAPAPQLSSPRAVAPVPREEPRVSFLKQSIAEVNGREGRLVEVNNLYGVMTALQRGSITSADLENTYFYFRDRLGSGSSGYSGTSFECIQVIELRPMTNDAGEVVNIYQALYFNSQISMTVTVDWYGVAPLKGQMLNTDFLSFGHVDSYKNKAGEDRSEVVFHQPRWSGRTGYVPANFNEGSSAPTTIAETIALCKKVQERPDISLGCGVEYFGGAPAMVISYPSKQLLGATSETITNSLAGPFCQATNSVNRQAFLVFVVAETREALSYSCESQTMSNWFSLDSSRRQQELPSS